MHIALTLLSGVGYGGRTYFQNLIPALAVADRENEYHLFVPYGHPLVARVKQENFIFHECVGKHQSALKRFLWEQLILPRRLKKYKIDLLFTAKNLNVFLAPCKTIISIRNVEPFAYQEYDNDWKLDCVSWIKWQLTKLSVRKADHIVAVSQAVKKRLMEKFPGVEKKVSVVYNGNPVVHDTNQQITDESTNMRIREFVDSHKIRRFVSHDFLLTASKFVAYANQLNLLKGYARLVKKDPNISPLWFAGGVHDKRYFQKVQKFVGDNHLSDRIKFLGLVSHDKLLELMRGAQAFVFPSTLESCPHTLIEAMACGVPIAASTTPPMPEICADAALYFDPNEPADIARAVERVMHDEAVRENLYSKGPARAQYFTWQKTVQGLVNVFML